jgi:hypothetical protein
LGPEKFGASAKKSLGLTDNANKESIAVMDLHQLSASDVAARQQGAGLSQEVVWLESRLTLAPWSVLSWGLFLPLVFAGNVVVATLAWFTVELVMR